MTPARTPSERRSSTISGLAGRAGSITSPLLVLAFTPALAQTPETEELVVIGERLEETIPQSLKRFGNRVETLGAADIELGGFNDLSQTLQMTVPGLYVAPKNGPFDYMNCSLQGSRCEDVLFLVDGVRIANRLYNTTAPLDTIPAHSIERVEVLYGGQGIFYGTQSAAGVVNIVTRSFEGEPAANVSVGFDEYDGTHLNADYATGFGDSTVVLYVSKDESDGFRPFAETDYQPSASDRKRGYDVLTVGAKYGYDFSPDSRLTVHYQRTDNELDNLLPYAVVSRNNARVEDLVTAKWDRSLGDNADLYIKAYYHDWDTKWDDIRNDIGPGGTLPGTQTVLYQDAFWGYEDYGITALASIRATELIEISAGYDYQRFWGNDEVWLIEDKTETAQAVYGQIRSSNAAFERSDVAFGVRYNTTSGSADGTVWTLSGRHDLTDDLYLRGQVGTSFRLPDAEELYLRDCCEVGNPNLEAERSKNLEIGIGGSPSGARALAWQLIYFTREIDNLIDIDFDNPAYPDGIFENFDETLEFDGWEVSLDAGLGNAFTVGFSYTRNDANLKGSSEQFQDIPESLLKAHLMYRSMRAPVEFNLSLVSVSDVADVVGGGIGRLSLEDYTVLDLGFAYFPDSERRHRIGLRLENALDEDYATSLGRGRRDTDNSSYAYRNLGAPRTLNATYSYRW